VLVSDLGAGFGQRRKAWRGIACLKRSVLWRWREAAFGANVATERYGLCLKRGESYTLREIMLPMVQMHACEIDGAAGFQASGVASMRCPAGWMSDVLFEVEILGTFREGYYRVHATTPNVKLTALAERSGGC